VCGARAGDEVVQLDVRDVLASVARPVMELKGFERVHLEPGQAKEVVFELGPEHLQMLDATLRWVVEPGTFRVMIGGSSKDIRLRGTLPGCGSWRLRSSRMEVVCHNPRKAELRRLKGLIDAHQVIPSDRPAGLLAGRRCFGLLDQLHDRGSPASGHR
jgi:hypothetical protein